MSLHTAASQLFDNLHFTHKVHEKQCEVLSVSSIALRIISVAGVVIVLLLQFWQILEPANTQLTRRSIVVTVFEVGLLVFQLSFNYDNLLDQHRNSAKKALAIKNRLLVYMSASNMTETKLNEFADEINDLYFSAPQTGAIAKYLANRS
jgi:dipeptide/tripeptide permease